MAAVCGTFATLMVSGSAYALDGAPYKVREGQATKASHDPILGNEASGYWFLLNPSSCSTRPYCTTIPLTVDVPADLRSDGDFIVQITLEWDARKVGDRSANDLDLYVWNGKSDPVPVATSATTEQVPEKIELFRPTKPQYFLTVANVTGANTGFTITGKLERRAAEPPFESIAPPPNRARPTPSSPPPPPPAAAQGVQVPANNAGPSAASPFESSLADVSRDPDLPTGGGTDRLTGLIAAPPAQLARSRPDRPPSPVGAATLLLWAVVVPAAALGAGATLVSRRRRALQALATR